MNSQDNPPPYYGPQQGIPMVQQPMPGQNVPMVVVASQQMGTEPSLIVCKSCQYQIMTRIELRPTMKTHLWALCCFVIGFWPCMCIPYCTPACMNVNHYCPNCSSYVGSSQF